MTSVIGHAGEPDTRGSVWQRLPRRTAANRQRQSSGLLGAYEQSAASCCQAAFSKAPRNGRVLHPREQQVLVCAAGTFLILTASSSAALEGGARWDHLANDCSIPWSLQPLRKRFATGAPDRRFKGAHVRPSQPLRLGISSPLFPPSLRQTPTAVDGCCPHEYRVRSPYPSDHPAAASTQRRIRPLP